MIKNNKGQALVEFIIVMPLLIMFIASIIDLAHVLSRRAALENELDVAVAMYRNNEIEEMNSYIKSSGMDIDIKNKGNITTLIISEEIKISAPGLNLVFGNPYQLEVERVIYEE